MPPQRTPFHQSKAAQLLPLRDGQAAQVILSTQLNPFLSLKALASYSGLSVRKLREYLVEPGHPLPSYRVGGKILVRRSEFDLWIASYRQVGGADVGQIMAEVLRGLS